MKIIHGTVVDIAGKGVLLCGDSASGKSDLALRLIDRGACLVADDQVCLESKSKGVFATAPQRLRGFLEVRGLGIISMPVTGGSYIKLIVHLDKGLEIPRLPEIQTENLLDVSIFSLTLNSFEQSVPIKIELALEDLSRIGGGGLSD